MAAPSTPGSTPDNGPRGYPPGSNDHALKVMVAAMAVGEAMLRSRAPTSEVEDSVRRLTTALELSECEVAVTQNQLILSVVRDGMDAPMTMVKVIDMSEVRLDLLAEVEDLIRRVETGEADPATATGELARIMTEAPSRPRWLNSLFYLISVAGWIAFAGGGWMGMAAGLVGALIIQLVITPLARSRIPEFFGVAFSSAVAIAAPATVAYLGWPIVLTPAMVGGLYPLLPGGALAASVTDWLGGAPLSGMAKGLQVALETAGLALGAVSVLTLVDHLGIESTADPVIIPTAVVALAATVAAVGLALSRTMPMRFAPGVAVVALAAWSVNWAMPETTATFPPSIFVAALTIGVGAQIMARIQRTNPIMFTTTTLFVLAPGLITYLAMAALTSGEPDTANELLIRALGIAAAIAAGIALGMSLTRRLPEPRQRVRPLSRHASGHRG